MLEEVYTDTVVVAMTSIGFEQVVVTTSGCGNDYGLVGGYDGGRWW